MPDHAKRRGNAGGASLAIAPRDHRLDRTATSEMSSLLRAVTILTTAVVTLTLQASCARSISSDGSDAPLVSPSASNPDPLSACIATDCPAPWASCRDGTLCSTNTSTDVENCGGCGNSCPHPTGALHASSVCSDGKCVLACEELNADCNHRSSDGCEVFTGDDPKNCGGCGLSCKEGEICWKGACGCPSGFTRCGTECVNLDSDNASCGVCDKKCKAPPSNDPEWKCGPDVQPINTGWSCAGGGCKLSCDAWFGDCNDNLCADGCETDTKRDAKNCGACGHACSANQECVDGQCLCPPGTTRCGTRCVDVNVDPNNCGACGQPCDGAGDTSGGTPTCTGGHCGYLCYAGFADCNGRTNDGCEINVNNNPLHCGSCGTQCARGQPCVLGQCLTKPCGPIAGTK